MITRMIHWSPGWFIEVPDDSSKSRMINRSLGWFIEVSDDSTKSRIPLKCNGDDNKEFTWFIHLYDFFGPYDQTSGGVTSGFGWVQTHPLSKRHPWDYCKSEDFFYGGVGGRVEREKAWAVSNCVKQIATSTRCYYSVQHRSLIDCSDHCRFWNLIQSRFA